MKNILNQFLFILTFLSSFLVKAQTYDLSLNLSKGETYKHKLSSEVDVFQDIGGDQIETNMVINSDINWLVKGIKKESYSMEVSYTALEIEMELVEGKMTFSSKTEETDVFSDLLKQIIDQPFSMVLTMDGRITKVGGMQEIFDEAFADLSGRVSNEKLLQLKSQFIKAIGTGCTGRKPSNSIKYFPKWCRKKG